MPRFKPDLSQKITIRTSSGLKELTNNICRRDDLPESDVVRYCLESGVQIAEQLGMAEIMRIREKLAVGMVARVEFEPAPKKKRAV